MPRGMGKASLGPSLRATDPWLPGNPSSGKQRQLLSKEEQARLATIASIARFKRNEIIYEEGDSADRVFNLISGMVATHKHGARGKRFITAILYPQDVFGLSEEGRYLNSATALTEVVVYTFPIVALRRLISKDAGMDMHFLVKLCHELREAQRHALVLAQRHVERRLAMFLSLQEHLQNDRNGTKMDILLPMKRSVIAEYLGVSPAAVSRAFRSLVRRKVIAPRRSGFVKIIDRHALDALISVSRRVSSAVKN